jgi:hypothetical protein
LTKCVDQWCEPTLGDLRIRIDERNVVNARTIPQGEVVATGEAEVPLTYDDINPEPLFVNSIDTAVVRRVVHDNNVKVLGRPVRLHERAQTSKGCLPALVVDDDDSDSRHVSRRQG